MSQVSWKLLLGAFLLSPVLGSLTTAPAQPGDSGEAAEESGDEESPLLVEPETAAEFLEAAELMVRLGRPKLARRYLQGLLELQPDDATLLRLRQEHGPALFLRLANNDDLQPASTDLLDQINEVFRRHADDPERIDGLLADLQEGPQKRQAALLALRNTGAAAVPRILQHLADASQAGGADRYLQTLVQMGEPVIPPLLGALQAPDADLRAAVVQVLGRIGSRDVVPHLWHPAFAESQPGGVRSAAREALARLLSGSRARVEEISSYRVADRLKQVAVDHYRGASAEAVEGEAVPVWSWDPEQETVAVSRLSPRRASLNAGTRLARQALELSGNRTDLQALYVGLSLALAVERSGWDRPVPTGPGSAYDRALTAGPEVLSEALSGALENQNAASAWALLQTLSRVGSNDQLSKKGAEQSPIVAALNYPHPRVQLAAATTVLELAPETRFPSAHRVVAILARTLNSGRSAAVVVDPNVQRGRDLAGMLSGMGYDATVAGTGQEGFRTAAERGDVELILLHMNTIRWGLSQTVANLRADARTAFLPIAVYGPEGMQSEVASLIQRHPLTTSVVTPHRSEYLSEQLRPFLNEIRSPRISEQERAERKAVAVSWLADIADRGDEGLFDLTAAEDALIRAAGEPRLASHALRAMGSVPTRDIQEQLQRLAVNPDKSADTRRAAAVQLSRHIRRHGLLLSQRGIRAIKAGWRSAEDPGVSTALASVLGALQPNSRLAGDRLRGAQPSPVRPGR